MVYAHGLSANAAAPLMTRNAAYLLYVGMLVVFTCFFILPILNSVKVAFVDMQGNFTMDYLWEVFGNQIYREGLFNSFWMAVWSTLGCLIVALPLAIIYVRYEYPGKAMLYSLVLTPMI